MGSKADPLDIFPNNLGRMYLDPDALNKGKDNPKNRNFDTNALKSEMPRIRFV